MTPQHPVVVEVNEVWAERCKESRRISWAIIYSAADVEVWYWTLERMKCQTDEVVEQL
jgi:hypothetical protein